LAFDFHTLEKGSTIFSQNFSDASSAAGFYSEWQRQHSGKGTPQVKNTHAQKL
jgi:hypothetical protein